APVVAGWREREWVDLTRERLRSTAKLSVDAAEPFLVQEDAGVVAGPGIETILLRPPPADADKQRNDPDVRGGAPSLVENALPGCRAAMTGRRSPPAPRSWGPASRRPRSAARWPRPRASRPRTRTEIRFACSTLPLRPQAPEQRP